MGGQTSNTGIGAMPVPFVDFFGALRNFSYFPYTDWTRMWEQAFSPRFYFGCNVDDAPTEQHVLDEVGSYGRQLNTLLDAMLVFLRRVDPQSLTEDERRRVQGLVELMDRADEAAAKFTHKPRQMLPSLLADWLRVPPVPAG